MSRAGGIIKTYFLTGATGVVGSAIVPRLLLDPDTRVRLLVRAKDETGLETRMGELMRFWSGDGEKAPLDRIEAVRGDATLPRFGLAIERYNALEHECTHVIHSAGTVRMNLPLEDARRSAVGSATEILALARRMADRGQLKKVEFVSTVGIAGKRAGALPETWIDEPREFHNTYEQAKAEAEDLVRQAVEKQEMPITVHRPSMVIGDSHDGRIIHFQIFYFICEFLSGRKTLGLYPDFGDVRLDVIPVDVVADAIVEASNDHSTAGKLLHLCSGVDAPPLETLKATVRAAFVEHGLPTPNSRTLPRKRYAFLARLAASLAPPSKRKALATLPVYLDYLVDRQSFGNTNFRDWLGSGGKRLPQPCDYLPHALHFYLRKKHCQLPAR